jgi:hypothetical protein
MRATGDRHGEGPHTYEGNIMTSLKEHIRNIEKAVKKHKGKHLTSAPPDEIERVLKRANTPIIYAFGPPGPVRPGQTIQIAFDVYNPGPDAAGSLSVHVWVGFHIVDATGGTFLLDVDKRFPRLTQPRWPGKSVDADSSERFGPFSLAIPTTVEKTNYILNACLVQWIYDARGGYHKFLNHLGLNIIEVIA